MFSLLGVRLAVRFIPKSLSTASPTFSRALFGSHFQSRSFLTTSRLLQAAAPAAARKTSLKVTSKSKPATPKKTVTKRKTAAKKKPVLKKKKLVLKKKRVLKKRVAAKKKKPAKKIGTVIPLSIGRLPKAGTGPFVIYFKEFHASRSAIHDLPGMHTRLQEAVSSWRTLSQQEKQPYFDKSAVIYRERREERLKWLKNIGPSFVREINRRRKLRGKPRLVIPRDPSIPKRIPSNFVFFSMDFRKSDDAIGLGPNDIFKRAGERWRTMSDTQKKVYTDKRNEAIAAQPQ